MVAAGNISGEWSNPSGRADENRKQRGFRALTAISVGRSKQERCILSDIFVSYAREDLGFVEPLVVALQAEGWTVWWDRLMPIGNVFDKSIERALSEARCVIVVWSKDSIGSDWVRNEAFEGKERGILIPVLLDNAAPPFGFRLINGIGFTNWSDQAAKASLRELVNAIEKLIGRRVGLQPARESRQASPPQIMFVFGLLVLSISVVVSTSLDQTAERGGGFRASPTEARPGLPVSESPPAKDVEAQTLQVEPSTSNDSASKSETSDTAADSYVPLTGGAPSVLVPDAFATELESTPVGTGQIVVVARTSRLAYKGLVFMIDDRVLSYEEILDSSVVEVARLSVPAGDHLLKVNPELGEQPIPFEVSAGETVEVEFYKIGLARFDWKVYIRGDRVR